MVIYVYIYIYKCYLTNICQTNMEELLDLTQESEGQMLWQERQWCSAEVLEVEGGRSIVKIPPQWGWKNKQLLWGYEIEGC